MTPPDHHAGGRYGSDFDHGSGGGGFGKKKHLSVHYPSKHYGGLVGPTLSTAAIAPAALNEKVIQEISEKYATKRVGNFNPTVWPKRPRNAKFFVIKSYGEDDVHKSIKYKLWASTKRGN